MGKDFTTNEAAAELGVTAGRVRQLIVDGELEATKHGRDLAISVAALARAKKRKTKPGPAVAARKRKTTRKRGKAK